MIKNKFGKLVFGLIVAMTFFSCKQEIADDDADKADLRNYNINGEVYTGSRKASKETEEEITFSAELTNDGRYNFYRLNDEYVGGEDLPQWIKETITVEDWENGIKIVYHRPKEQPVLGDKSISWFNVEYVDGNGNVSTSTTVPWDKMNINNDSNGWNPIAKDTFSVEFPLVNPGKKSIICVEYGYKIGEGNDNQFALNFAVMPVHGKGCIKDLKKHFTSEGEPNPESVKHAILDDTDEGLILNIKNVFPPEGKNLRQAYNIHEQTENTKYFAGDWDQVGWVDEAVEDPSKKYSIDLTKFSEFNNSKNRKYLFCEFNYSYELEEFPGLIFRTPIFKTEIIECDKFHK